MSAGNRVCPQCGNATAGLMCPIDGWATVPAAIVSEARLKPGTSLLSAYRVGAFLEDDGAMAIYGGSRIDNGKPVRIATVILPPSASLPEIARMQRSAHQLEEIKHPNIAQVLASGTTDRGDLAIVSEHIEGPTLAELLRGGELGPDRALALGIGLFQALEAAHAAGVAHHDLSPERIRMAPGRVVVCDFGLADILRTPKSGAPWGSGEGDVPLLSQGLPYRAPEQARDRAVTKQADIYAVGAILYEALTGRPLFVEKSSADYLIAHMLKAPTAPAPRNDIVFDGLAELVMKCLEKKPWNRPENATVARETLEDLRNRAVEVMAHSAGRPVPASRRVARPVLVEVVEAAQVPPPLEGAVSAPSATAPSIFESATPPAQVDSRAAEARAKAAMSIAETASAIAASAGSLVESANQAVEAARAKGIPTSESTEIALSRSAALAPTATALGGPSGLLTIAEIAKSSRGNEAKKEEATAPDLPPLGVASMATRGGQRPTPVPIVDDGSKPSHLAKRPGRSRWGIALAAGLLVGLGAVGLWIGLGPDPLTRGANPGRFARVEREVPGTPAPTAPVESQAPKSGHAAPAAGGEEAVRPEVKAAEAGVELKAAEAGVEPKAAEAGAEAKAAEAGAEVKAEEARAGENVVKSEAEVKAVEPPRPTITAAEASKRARLGAAQIDEARVSAMRKVAPNAVSAKVEQPKTVAAPPREAPVTAPVVAAALPHRDLSEGDEVALREASEEAEARRAAKAAEVAKKAEEARRRTEERKAVERPTTPPGPARPEEPKTDEPSVWRVLLSSVPPGAAVLVDGKSVGRTPMTLTWAPNKSASVWVTLAGFEPANFQVGERQNGKMMRVELIPVGGAAAEGQ